MGIKKGGIRVSFVVVIVLFVVLMLLPEFITARRARGGCTHMSFCSYGRHARRKKNVDARVNGGRSMRRRRRRSDGGGGKNEQRVDQPDRDGSDSSRYGDYEDYYYRRYGDVPSPGIGH